MHIQQTIPKSLFSTSICCLHWNMQSTLGRCGHIRYTMLKSHGTDKLCRTDCSSNKTVLYGSAYSLRRFIQSKIKAHSFTHETRKAHRRALWSKPHDTWKVQALCVSQANLLYCFIHAFVHAELRCLYSIQTTQIFSKLFITKSHKTLFFYLYD